MLYSEKKMIDVVNKIEASIIWIPAMVIIINMAGIIILLTTGTLLGIEDLSFDSVRPIIPMLISLALIIISECIIYAAKRILSWFIAEENRKEYLRRREGLS